jgi:hypothetical protein
MTVVGATFRLYLDGELADEDTPATPEAIEACAERQGDLAASHAGRYLVEVEFPDGEFVRFGDDAAGMRDPIALEGGLGRLADFLLETRWR